MKRQTLSLVLTALLVAVAAATAPSQEDQHGTSATKVQRLNRAPVSKEILQVKLPRPTVTRLPNGLKVLVLEQHKLPTVAFTLLIKSGAMSDPKDLSGIASFTADMLREGTAHRTSAQLAADVDNIGATLAASAHFGSNSSDVMASGLSTDTSRILELMSDAALNPTFPEDEIDKYKKRKLSELEQEKGDPAFLGQRELHAVLYRTFPAAEYSATPDSVNRITPAQLKEFHDRYYVPSNAILGVVGDVKTNEVTELTKKYFGNWKNRPSGMAELGELPPASPFKIYLVDRPGSVQTNIVIGDYGARRSDPDYIPLVVMNRVLGGGPTGRLFLNLREEKGYTYGAYSAVGDDIYREAWQATTEVRTAVTDGSMHELMYEFKRIRDQQVPLSELDEARHAIVANFALSLEQPQRLLFDWLLVEYYGLPQDYWDRFPAEVARVSQEELQQAAKKYVDLDHLQIVCVGDAKQIRSALEKYGPVEVRDADGKRMD